jgi:tripeptidyl-peptidase-1
MKSLVLFAFLAAASAWVQLESDLKIEGVVRGWDNVGTPEAGATHKVLFSLKALPEKLEALERNFWELSNPKHPRYGQYFNHEQLAELIGAPQTTIDGVMSYLASFGIQGKLRATRDHIEAEAPVQTLEKVFNTKLSLFERNGHRIIRASAYYYLPSAVQGVAVVSGLLDFPNYKEPRIMPEKEQAPGTAAPSWTNYCNGTTTSTTVCSSKITPQVIAQKYSISNMGQAMNAKSNMGVAEFQTQYYDPNDLSGFATQCNLPPITVIDKNGGNKPSVCQAGGCVEAELDLEYIHGVAGNYPLADYFLLQYSLLDWVNQIIADTNTIWVHSVSYGNDEVQQTSTSYMQQCSTQFQAAGVMGISIMFASGDQGVWGRTGPNPNTFNPDFPAASPYITAVGGTDFQTTSPNITSTEVCCRDSGGGFSTFFVMPSYQTAKVQNYLTTAASTLPASHFYNASNRAYPDVSANFGLEVSYCMYEASKWVGVAGTSASSPVFTSAIVNLNNMQRNAGKPPLGFLNQWLYGLPTTAFTDIIGGQNNEGTGTGFTATAGWDPCTGLGTPIMSQMAAHLP